MNGAMNYTDNANEFLKLTIELQNRRRTVVVVESFVGLLIAVLALCGNILVCVASFRSPRLRKSSNFYVISLAVSDIILATLAMPFTLSVLISGQLEFASFWCTFQAVVAVLSSKASILTMTLAALHRYFKLIMPSFYKKIYTTTFMISSLATAWILSGFGLLIYALQGNNFIFVPPFALCTFDYYTIDMEFAVTIAIVYSTLPFNIIIFCYFKIWRFVRSHNVAMQTSQVSTEEIRITKLVMCIVVCFALCWSPLAVVVIVVAFRGITTIPREVCLLVIFTSSLSSCTNPIIYNAMSKDFRDEFRNILCAFQRSRVVPVESTARDRIALSYKKS